MNIIEALDDPGVFRAHFKGQAGTWAAWRVLLQGVFALPMDPADLELFRHHTGRELQPTQPAREACIVVGRRGGKSRVLALIAVYLATFRSYEEYLAPGEVATIGLIAVDRKQARSAFRFVMGLLRAVPDLAGMIVDETMDTVTLSNHVCIEIGTASMRSTRGYSYAAVIIDEIAFLRDENSANPDQEIVTALRPGMSSIPGSLLVMASSPYRKKGILYTTFRKHHGVEGSRVIAWRGTSLEMNPSLDPEIVAEAFADDPVSAEAEYNAAWRTDIDDYISRDLVLSAVVPGRVVLPCISLGHTAFVDVAGGGADSFVLAIGHRGPGGVGVLDMLHERQGPCSPESAIAEFADLLRLYNLNRVTGDFYAGSYPTEVFKRYGIEYEKSENTKSQIYTDALPLLRSGRLELLEHERMISQLCSLERRTGRGGKDSIDHPPGQHDDCCNAAMGCLLMVAGQHDTLSVWNKIGEGSAGGRATLGGSW